jgi:thiol-disulfide isomerase/thioredoxin
VKLETIDEAGLKTLVKNDSDKLLVINVWASWCGPCMTELPEFVTMNRMYRGRKFKMVTITLDEPEHKEDVLKALEKLHVAATNYLPMVESKDKLADILDKEWKGPVPYTILVAPGGKVIYRKANSIEPLEVRRVIADFLGRTYANK